MAEHGGCCYCCRVLQTCCHRPDPRKNDIMEGIFEIDHSPWFSLSATGRSVAFRLFSSIKVDPSTKKGIESETVYLIQGKVIEREKVAIKKGSWLNLEVPTRVIKFKLKFEVGRDFGPPGAFVIENGDNHDFFLKSATLRYTSPPGQNNVFQFYCNSWVHPVAKTGVKRVFFSNQLYLPNETPPGLRELRQKELKKLRTGSKGERQPWDRIYEYDYYNDLGNPDNGREYARPVLGGSAVYPYPRRLRTGRPPCEHDQLSESRPTGGCFQIYVPPDERLSKEKQKELTRSFADALVRFLTPTPDRPPRSYQECPDIIKKIVHFFVPGAAGEFKFVQSMIDTLFRRNPKASSSTQAAEGWNIEDFFAGKEVKEMDVWMKQKLEKLVPPEILNQVVAMTSTTKRNILKSQLPSIIAGGEEFAWAEDNEFGRQMLAGTNPIRIRRLAKEDFSAESGIKHLLDKVIEMGFEIQEVMGEDRAYILEHYDYLMPFLSMINGKDVCAYATRTILIANQQGMLEPAAIQLGLPPSDSDNDRIIFPENDMLWLLAKLHVAANDAAYHQLVSHWLHTHAVIEPFIIATRRQLSVMHPIHRLLDPHFKDTLHINALARGIFLNAGGILEATLFTGEFSMRLSSQLYKQWRFDEQALPKDLVKRGMAKMVEESLVPKINQIIMEKQAEDEPEKLDDKDGDQVERDEDLTELDENAVELDNNPGVVTDKTKPDEKVTYTAGVKLILEDYPYAKDGIEIWDAIENWVRAYCEIFYGKDDKAVEADEEIRQWWHEIKREGHPDIKEGWYELTTFENLVKALTTLIWITSGLHAAVNFGQYAYNGWPPNRPMLLRKFIPRPKDKEELKELNDAPEKFLVQMLPEKFQAAFVIAVMDLLSRHTSDEVYLGQWPPGNKWEENKPVDEEFEKFRESLIKIEKNIMLRNKEYNLMNRWGSAKIPYKLLYPDTSRTRATSKKKGEPDKMDITGRGIPNSISI